MPRVANLRLASTLLFPPKPVLCEKCNFVGFSENYAVESGSVGVSHTGAIKIANLDAGQPVHLI